MKYLSRYVKPRYAGYAFDSLTWLRAVASAFENKKALPKGGLLGRTERSSGGGIRFSRRPHADPGDRATPKGYGVDLSLSQWRAVSRPPPPVQTSRPWDPSIPSLPPWPNRWSPPGPPIRLSQPPPPLMRSWPFEKNIRSRPASPNATSSPRPARMVS